MTASKTSYEHHVRFLMDPGCPWTWKTSLWIRAAARVRPIEIQWDLLALEFLNRDVSDHPMRGKHIKSRKAFRLFYKAGQTEGNEAVDRLYLAAGRLRYDDKRELDDDDMLKKALIEAGLPESLAAEAENDGGIDKVLESLYETNSRDGVFGVPTLFFDRSEDPFFGPVIDTVPPDEEAGDLFDHILGLTRHDYFYEIKRPRV